MRAGQKHWHMRCQKRMTSQGHFRISNGWREFSYDHTLKLNDMLVFTLVSPSHFVVAFATCVMRPTRDGKEYPWMQQPNSMSFLKSSKSIQGVAMAKTPSKQTDREGGLVSECNAVKIKNRKIPLKDISWHPTKGFVPRKVSKVLGAASARAKTTDMSTPPSFTKVLHLKYEIHTSNPQCRLSLPKQFCDKHNVADHVTMTDSTGQKLWHMRCQNRVTSQGLFRIGNGWREFSFDHSLKLNDKLEFTLLSPSHFVVEYATRVLRPTRDGKDYPWKLRRHSWAWENYSEYIQGMAMANAMLPRASKRTRVGELLCQHSAVKTDNQMSIGSEDTEKMRIHLLELTHLECKNPDGTSFLQILESDSEITNEDEEIAPEYNQGDSY